MIAKVATIDRFGRVVIPRKLRQQLNLHPGTKVEVKAGPNGTVQVGAKDPEPLPEGLGYVDGKLVITAPFLPGAETDIAAIMQRLDDERTAQLMEPWDQDDQAEPTP
jgi:AbrB family looped-hinge helix DNA binding protein